MIPQFRHGEVVRVVALTEGWEPNVRWVVGSEGVVRDVASPNDTETGWCYSVWIEERDGSGRTLWGFDEVELVTTGTVEVDNARVPIGETDAPVPLHDGIYLRLITPLTVESEAVEVRDLAVANVRALIPNVSVDVQVEAHWHEPYYYEVQLTLTGGDAFAACGALIRAGGLGWESVDDDGWRVDAWWSDAHGEHKSVFLAPAVSHANLVFSAWDSPRSRPESKRVRATMRE